MRYLFDTNICIYILKRRYLGILDRITEVGPANVAVSSITIAEMEYGIAKSSKAAEAEARLYAFLLPFTIVDFDVKAARQHGRIRRDLCKVGTPIGVMDMLISAIAIANDMTLVTNNVREFERVGGLRLENWAGA